MSETDKNTAGDLGCHLDGGALIEQANLTKTLVLADMDRLKAEGLLSDGDVPRLDSAIDEVHKGLEDRTLATNEARLQTAEQSAAVHEVKAGRRRLNNCVERVFRNQPELAEYRQGTYHGTNIAALCTDLNRKLAFAHQHESRLAPVGAGKQFLDSLQAQVRALEQSSGAQDAAIVSLPDNTRSFGEIKAQLYYIIKDFNNAGRALHASDLETAAKYNLKVLYGRRKNKAPEPPAPGPGPAPAQ